MSKEKKLENIELNDETMGEVSGGGSATFSCNKCGKEVVYRFDNFGPGGKTKCPHCQTAYHVDYLNSTVTQIDTDDGVADLRWEGPLHSKPLTPEPPILRPY